MGQQQLLLIVLGIIIVGIAIAVGVTTFRSSAVDANRAQVISDLNNLAAKSQRYYRTPTSMGGGGQDMNGFAISALDTGNANGSYSVTTTAPSGNAFVAGSVAAISASAQTIYIVGCGKEDGDDSTNKVKAYVTCTPTSIAATKLN
jgi:Tfp pilus assembly protein PilE